MTADKIRNTLDNWRFWVGVAYFGLVIVIIGLYVLYGKQSKEATKRVAIQQAAAQTQVTNCINSVDSAPLIYGFIDGQRTIIENQITSTRQALAVAVKGDPLIPVRQRALIRLGMAKTNNKTLFVLVKSTTPTKLYCIRLAARMNVPYHK